MSSPPHAALAALRLTPAASASAAAREPHFLETLLSAADGTCGAAAPSRGSGSPREAAARADDPSKSDDDDSAEFDSGGDSDGGSDGAGAWQAPGDTWACAACTYACNFESDALCVICGCGAPAAPAEAVVALVWRCGACTLDNAAEALACAACGEAPPPPRSSAADEAPHSARAWPGAPPRRRRAAWSCTGCTLVNGGHRAECEACGMPDFAADEGDSAPPDARIDGAAADGSKCPACGPRRACPAHRDARLRGSGAAADARERARTEAWLDWERRGLVPLAKPDAEEEAAALRSVDARTRRATLRAAGPAAARSAGGHAPTAEQFRDMYGGNDGDAEEDETGGICLDTRWEEGREPRRRVALLQAAGWRRVWGGRGSHPKWRRTLPGGAGAQVLVFASTPSSQRSWNHEAAALQRADRQAAEKLGLAAMAAQAGPTAGAMND